MLLLSCVLRSMYVQWKTNLDFNFLIITGGFKYDLEALASMKETVAVAVGKKALLVAESGVEAAGELGAVAGEQPSTWSSKAGSCLAVVVFWVSHTASVYATRELLSRPGRTARGVVVITWCQVRVNSVSSLSLTISGRVRDGSDKFSAQVEGRPPFET